MARLEGLYRDFWRAGERVCCAVSGGADSVAMLLGLHEANAAKESLGVVLSAVHVHHGLRGAEADADAGFVRELCDRLRVPLRTERVDTRARQAAAREGIEEAARHLRYAVFERVLAEGQADSVATAHTLDDQAETVVMKLLRGAWTEGLGGISPILAGGGSAIGGSADDGSGAGGFAVGRMAGGRGRPAGSEPGGGRVVRPMLEVRRAEIEAYLRERQQPWREDGSNADLSLTRNRVRHELMPVLRDFNPRIDVLLARTAAIAREEELYWRAEVARYLPGLLLPGKPVRGGGRAVSTAVGERAFAIELERLKGMEPALRRRMLRAAAATLGCRLTSEETGKLFALVGVGPEAQGARLGSQRGPRIGTRLELANGLRAERSARELRLSRYETSTAEDVEKR